MLKTIVGQFKDGQDAKQALRNLYHRGFDRHSIAPTFTDQGFFSEIWQAGFFGAVSGASIGVFIGLFSAISRLSVYRLNNLMATGAWNEFFSLILLGTAISAVIGGILFLTIIWLGLCRTEHHSFIENAQQNGMLVTVKAKNHHVSQVKRIMEQARAIDCQVT